MRAYDSSGTLVCETTWCNCREGSFLFLSFSEFFFSVSYHSSRSPTGGPAPPLATQATHGPPGAVPPCLAGSRPLATVAPPGAEACGKHVGRALMSARPTLPRHASHGPGGAAQEPVGAPERAPACQLALGPLHRGWPGGPDQKDGSVGVGASPRLRTLRPPHTSRGWGKG